MTIKQNTPVISTLLEGPRISRGGVSRAVDHQPAVIFMGILDLAARVGWTEWKWYRLRRLKIGCVDRRDCIKSRLRRGCWQVAVTGEWYVAVEARGQQW